MNVRKDWRIKDNLIICLNIINKHLMKSEDKVRLFTIVDVTRAAKKIAKQERCSMLEATCKYKDEVKKKYK